MLALEYDNIITSALRQGGFYADDTVTVEVADNVRVKMAKDAVTVRKPQG